mgnify:CR=1 FL=1
MNQTLIGLVFIMAIIMSFYILNLTSKDILNAKNKYKITFSLCIVLLCLSVLGSCLEKDEEEYIYKVESISLSDKGILLF